MPRRSVPSAAVNIHYVAIVGTIIAVGSLAAAAFAAKIARDGRAIMKLAADATVAQAASTADAARAADAAAQAADTVARIEIDRRHDEMYPNVRVTFSWDWNDRTQHHNLFADVVSRSDRDYHVEYVRLNESSGSVSKGGIFTLGAGQTHRTYVCQEHEALPTALGFEFDAVDPCPCPRQTSGGHHWARSFAVDRPEVPDLG